MFYLLQAVLKSTNFFLFYYFKEHCFSRHFYFKCYSSCLICTKTIAAYTTTYMTSHDGFDLNFTKISYIALVILKNVNIIDALILRRAASNFVWSFWSRIKNLLLQIIWTISGNPLKSLIICIIILLYWLLILLFFSNYFYYYFHYKIHHQLSYYYHYWFSYGCCFYGKAIISIFHFDVFLSLAVLSFIFDISIINEAFCYCYSHHCWPLSRGFVGSSKFYKQHIVMIQ